MAIYELKCHHHRKAWRNGDLEAEDVISMATTFKTKKAANDWLRKQEFREKANGYKTISRIAIKADEPSELIVYTGNTWIHENSGEEERERYYYKVTKK